MLRPRTRRLLDEFWQSQARIGATASAEALASWPRVNPVDLERTGPAWIGAMILILRAARGRSWRNAIAFYRLYRAYETGYTVVLPHETPGPIPLGQLRQEWAHAAQFPYVPQSDDAVIIDAEEFDWPEIDDDGMDRAAAISLAATGPARVRKIVREHTEPDPLEEEDDGRGRLDDPDFLESLESAGRNAAQVADQEAVRAGRALVDQASAKDRRVIGWARVTDNDPCHFCAMLAARGAVYRSKKSATTGPDDLSKYHPGCHCQVVPVYSRTDFMNPEARRLAREWREVTRGTSGAESLKAWRRHIEGQRRARRRST